MHETGENALEGLRVLAEGLAFPEGPVAMPDGSVLVVEIEGERLTRVLPDGRKETVCEISGGPNGAAIGPDGACYVCNNGGLEWNSFEGYGRFPTGTPASYTSGSIERVDLRNGTATRLYDRTADGPLGAPNDLVFDRHGGFWFTDPGKAGRRDTGNGAVFYATADGFSIERKIWHIASPNGIALSADEKRLYVIEALTARLWVFDLTGPGQIAQKAFPSPNGGRFVGGSSDFMRFDSMALDSEENACIGTLFGPGGITVISGDGSRNSHVAIPDALTSNICFGGPNLRTAFVTGGGTGRLYSLDWPTPGLMLNYYHLGQ
ncbi:MAG: SMP-30/gluconolactonase/LRE family protein [Rhizobiaceae bacterium]|nr:SMP-30/gluconolactonase/LRE family protein [Rhizobiaceae bacterium]